MYPKCAYCGKQLHDLHEDGYRTNRISRKFDTDKCRDMYWADVRKIERAYQRANKSLDVLLDLSERGSGVSKIARMYLDSMLAEIRQAVGSK